MYECSVCHQPVTVDHINPPVKPCGCNGTIYASMSGGLSGKGALNATVSNNNLTDESALIVKLALIGLTNIEFLKNGKTEVFVNEQVVQDEKTGKKFKFTITGVEA